MWRQLSCPPVHTSARRLRIWRCIVCRRVASFYKVQNKHIKRGVTGCVHVCFKFHGVSFCQELAKLGDIWLSYHKNKMGDVFLRLYSRHRLHSVPPLWQQELSVRRTNCRLSAGAPYRTVPAQIKRCLYGCSSVYSALRWCGSADGKYEVSYKPNVVIRSEGDVLWIPPAIYRSSCPISVKYFPFDEQKCEMKFGSWTFNSDQVHPTLSVMM